MNTCQYCMCTLAHKTRHDKKWVMDRKDCTTTQIYTDCTYHCNIFVFFDHLTNEDKLRLHVAWPNIPNSASFTSLLLVRCHRHFSFAAFYHLHNIEYTCTHTHKKTHCNFSVKVYQEWSLTQSIFHCYLTQSYSPTPRVCGDWHSEKCVSVQCGDPCTLDFQNEPWDSNF